MAQLDVVRSAIRNAVRACLVTSANQAALLNDFPHGGTELGEIAGPPLLGVQDEVYTPNGWEYGGPVDHSWRSYQKWVLALKLRALEDPEWRKIAFRAVATTDGYVPASGTLKADLPGFVAPIVNPSSNPAFLLLSPVDRSHQAVLCYAPIRRLGSRGISWGASAPAEGSLLFDLGRHATLGESVAVDTLEHLKLS